MTPTKDDALLERIQRTLEYFTDEFKDDADVWNSPVSSYSGGITPNDLIAIKQALTQPPVDVDGDDGVYLTDDELEDMVNQRECMQAEIDDLRQEIADLKAELEDR